MPLTSTVSPSRPTAVAVLLVEAPVRGEAAVGEDERHVVDAVVGGQRESGTVVVDQEQPEQPPVDVALGLPVGVRVVPERRRRLVDAPGRLPRGAGCDRLVRAAVGAGGHARPVPVGGRGLGQPVGHPEHDVVPARHPHRGAAERQAAVAPGRGRDAGEEGARAGGGDELDDPPARRVAGRRRERRDREGAWRSAPRARTPGLPFAHPATELTATAPAAASVAPRKRRRDNGDTTRSVAAGGGGGRRRDDVSASYARGRRDPERWAAPR